MTSRRRSRQGGFSYIEILVGIVILAIVAGGIAQGLALTSATLGTSKLETTANKVASSELDRAHRMAYDDVGTVGGSPPGVFPVTRTVVVAGVGYRLDVDVVYVDDPGLGQPQTYVNYKKVTATVTPQAARTKPYSQSTIIAPPAHGAVAGKSTIIATVIDAITDQPVVGAPVTADLSTSPTQTRATDAQGKVVFAGLEPSAIASTDPKYKYRLTVGLPAPWVTHPDNVPALAQQHLTASQTWTTTLRVFKKATIQVNLLDAATNQLITERSEVMVTTPGPNVLTEVKDGTTGLFEFTTIGGAHILPSTSNFTVAAQAECYADASLQRPVPVGYPANTTEAFTFAMTREPSGYIDVLVVNNSTGVAIPGAQVQVSGGGANIAPRVRTADAAGRVSFCVPPSGSASYVVSAAQPGYGAGSVLASVAVNARTPVTMRLNPSPTTGTIRLSAGSSNKLVRLKALTGTYDAVQTTNGLTTEVPAGSGNFYTGNADFTGLAGGTYEAYVATGFSGGAPVWSSPAKIVTATGGQLRAYRVP